jgi:hypothetical protein
VARAFNDRDENDDECRSDGMVWTDETEDES